MAKTKHLKYQRVQTLPNVVIPGGEPVVPLPWQRPPWSGKGLILELGCGKGEHSLALARDFPDQAVVGVDLKSHRLCTGGEQGLRLGLSNLFFLRARVQEILAYMGQNTVREIWLTFPDPHPKQREIRHRLTAPDFMAAYAVLLRPGGLVHLKTDSDLLFDYTRGVVADWGGTLLLETRDLMASDLASQGLAGVVSAFQKKAENRNHRIKYLRFRLD